MTRPLLLASSSNIRLQLLQAAGLDVSASPARIDEDHIRQSLEREQATPRDIADTLAEMKAAKLAAKNPQDLVLGCDQVLDFRGTVLCKPETRPAARDQLLQLRGQKHRLISAIVLFDGAKPIWRHIAHAELTMRSFTDSYLDAYLDRNWPGIADSVGSYKLEQEGIRLFTAIDGDYFTILGLPLLPLLSYLTERGFLAK